MLSFTFEESLGQPYRAFLFVNGWMMGKRVANLGFVVSSLPAVCVTEDLIYVLFFLCCFGSDLNQSSLFMREYSIIMEKSKQLFHNNRSQCDKLHLLSQ